MLTVKLNVSNQIRWSRLVTADTPQSQSYLYLSEQVGVDVNLAISQEWLFAPLQFVAGLGPRKAASLRAQMVAQTAVRRRRELAEEPFFLGPVVFLNAATGLRLRAQEDVLDDTRIHPADDRLALQVAMDA